MKYGIKTQGNKILAVSRFKDDNLLPGYDEVTKDKYLDLVDKVNTDIHGTYVNGEFKGESDVAKAARENQQAQSIATAQAAHKDKELRELAAKLTLLGVSGTEISKYL